MKNVLRGLIYDEQVSITLINCTDVVRYGLSRHRFTGKKALLFAKALCYGAFMSAGLKERKGEVSLVFKAECGTLTVSGDFGMNIRGCFDQTGEIEKGFGQGTLTVVRDDGYARPFVGTCELLEDEDESMSEYFRISEQLPTFVATKVDLNEEGGVDFASIAVLQPLPFADEKTLEKMPKGDALYALAAALKEKSGLVVANEYSVTCISEKTAKYNCRCSKDYLKGVLVSVGEQELRRIIDEDGAVRVHCHYCNTDYEFFHSDVDEMFNG